MQKEVRQLDFSAEQTASVIIDNLASLAGAAAYKKYGRHGIISEVKVDNYNDMNNKVKTAILKFAAQKSGMEVPNTASELAFAFDNAMFRSIMNTITTKALGLMMVRYDSPQIGEIASIETVGVGESRSYEIDTKGLQVAQRATYGSNVSLVPSYAKSSVTITPKPYTLGSSLDFIRILGNEYDWGAEVARIYAGMLFAQYKLIVSKVFNTSIMSGTPFYQATFASPTYTQMADDIGMLNGGDASSVTAFGTRVAFNAISALATSGGFTTKDDYIKNGFLQKIYGVDSVILDQFTNLAAPFNSTNAPTLRAIPNNLLVLVSTNGDKVVKLVREDYVRVIETPAHLNTSNRAEYTYFQSFDADIATASYFGVQNTSS